LRLSICLRILRTSLISFYVPFASAIIDRSEVSVHCVMLLTYSYRTTNENIPGGKTGRRIIRFRRLGERECLGDWFTESFDLTLGHSAFSAAREYSSLFPKCGRCWLSSEILSGSKSVGSSFLATNKPLAGRGIRLTGAHFDPKHE